MEPDLEGFVRKYNARRLLSKLLVALVFVSTICLRCWRFGYSHGVDAALLLGTIVVSLVVYYCACKCPSCGRFIGYREYSRSLPRGAPCELENKAFERLDWPD